MTKNHILIDLSASDKTKNSSRTRTTSRTCCLLTYPSIQKNLARCLSQMMLSRT